MTRTWNLPALRAAFGVATAIGLLWGLVEALLGLARGGGEPLTVALALPLLAVGLAVPIPLFLARLPAERSLPWLAGGLVWVVTAIPAAIWINACFLRNVPAVSATNAALALACAAGALLPAAAVFFAMRRKVAALLARRAPLAEAAAWGLPAAFLVLCAAHSWGLVVPPRPGPWPPSPPGLSAKPNVLLLVLDTLRQDHLSRYGYSRSTTPNLDALPAVQFQNAYTQAPWTLAATASLLTGLYPSTHGANTPSSALPPAATTLTDLLAREGYVTGYFTANFLVGPTYGFAKSADHVVWDGVAPAARLMPSSLGFLLSRGIRETMRADRMTDLVLPFLRCVRDRRFFLYLHYYDPHDPYDPPAPFDRKFDPSYTGRDIRDPLVEKDSGITPREREHIIARYDGEIRFLDGQIGRVLDEMRRLGVFENTLLVVTADHGEEFHEHEGWTHGISMYEPALRVPLLVAMPGHGERRRGIDASGGGANGAAGRRVIRDPVRLVDVLPTILELLDLDPDPRAQGRSLVPYLRGGRIDGRETAGVPRNTSADRPVFAEHSYRGRASYLDGRYKLIRTRTDAGAIVFQLYDIREDPLEKDDLIVRRPEIAARLREELEAAEARYREQSLEAHPRHLSSEERERLRQLGYLK